MSGRQKSRKQKINPAQESFQVACGMVRQNPVLGTLRERVTIHFDDSYPMAISMPTATAGQRLGSGLMCWRTACST